MARGKNKLRKGERIAAKTVPPPPPPSVPLVAPPPSVTAAAAAAAAGEDPATYSDYHRDATQQHDGDDDNDDVPHACDVCDHHSIPAYRMRVVSKHVRDLFFTSFGMAVPSLFRGMVQNLQDHVLEDKIMTFVEHGLSPMHITYAASAAAMRTGILNQIKAACEEELGEVVLRLSTEDCFDLLCDLASRHGRDLNTWGPACACSFARCLPCLERLVDNIKSEPSSDSLRSSAYMTRKPIQPDTLHDWIAKGMEQGVVDRSVWGSARSTSKGPGWKKIVTDAWQTMADTLWECADTIDPMQLPSVKRVKKILGELHGLDLYYAVVAREMAALKDAPAPDTSFGRNLDGRRPSRPRLSSEPTPRNPSSSPKRDMVAPVPEVVGGVHLGSMDGFAFVRQFEALRRATVKPSGKKPTLPSLAQLEARDESGETHRWALGRAIRELGNGAYSAGSYAEACEHYTRAMAYDASEPVYPLNRAACYLKLKRFAEAEADCSAALTLDPNNHKAYFRRGVALSALLKVDEAMKDFYRVLKLNEDDEKNYEGLKKLADRCLADARRRLAQRNGTTKKDDRALPTLPGDAPTTALPTPPSSSSPAPPVPTTPTSKPEFNKFHSHSPTSTKKGKADFTFPPVPPPSAPSLPSPQPEIKPQPKQALSMRSPQAVALEKDKQHRLTKHMSNSMRRNGTGKDRFTFGTLPADQPFTGPIEDKDHTKDRFTFGPLDAPAASAAPAAPATDRDQEARERSAKVTAALESTPGAKRVAALAAEQAAAQARRSPTPDSDHEEVEANMAQIAKGRADKAGAAQAIAAAIDTPGAQKLAALARMEHQAGQVADESGVDEEKEEEEEEDPATILGRAAKVRTALENVPGAQRVAAVAEAEARAKTASSAPVPPPTTPNGSAKSLTQHTPIPIPIPPAATTPTQPVDPSTSSTSTVYATRNATKPSFTSVPTLPVGQSPPPQQAEAIPPTIASNGVVASRQPAVDPSITETANDSDASLASAALSNALASIREEMVQQESEDAAQHATLFGRGEEDLTSDQLERMSKVEIVLYAARKAGEADALAEQARHDTDVAPGVLDKVKDLASKMLQLVSATDMLQAAAGSLTGPSASAVQGVLHEVRSMMEHASKQVELVHNHSVLADATARMAKHAEEAARATAGLETTPFGTATAQVSDILVADVTRRLGQLRDMHEALDQLQLIYLDLDRIYRAAADPHMGLVHSAANLEASAAPEDHATIEEVLNEAVSGRRKRDENAPPAIAHSSSVSQASSPLGPQNPPPVPTPPTSTTVGSEADYVEYDENVEWGSEVDEAAAEPLGETVIRDAPRPASAVRGDPKTLRPRSSPSPSSSSVATAKLASPANGKAAATPATTIAPSGKSAPTMSSDALPPTNKAPGTPDLGVGGSTAPKRVEPHRDSDSEYDVPVALTPTGAKPTPPPTCEGDCFASNPREVAQQVAFAMLFAELVSAQTGHDVSRACGFVSDSDLDRGYVNGGRYGLLALPPRLAQWVQECKDARGGNAPRGMGMPMGMGMGFARPGNHKAGHGTQGHGSNNNHVAKPRTNTTANLDPATASNVIESGLDDAFHVISEALVPRPGKRMTEAFPHPCFDAKGQVRIGIPSPLPPHPFAVWPDLAHGHNEFRCVYDRARTTPVTDRNGKGKQRAKPRSTKAAPATEGRTWPTLSSSSEAQERAKNFWTLAVPASRRMVLMFEEATNAPSTNSTLSPPLPKKDKSLSRQEAAALLLMGLDWDEGLSALDSVLGAAAASSLAMGDKHRDSTGTFLRDLERLLLIRDRAGKLEQSGELEDRNVPVD